MHFVSLIESTASPVNATSASQPISRRACITITQEGPPTHLRRLVTCLTFSNRTKARRSNATSNRVLVMPLPEDAFGEWAPN
jgi:hypothetical protein